MKSTFFQVGKEGMSPKLVTYPAYNLNVSLPPILGVDQDIIQIYNHKSIEFLR